MKFAAVLALAALAHAATPVAPRQASASQTVRTVLEGVISDINALNSAVGSFTGDTSQLAGVQSTISTLEDALNSGAQTFAALQPVSTNDALGLSSLVQPLEDDTSQAVNTVIGKKDTIVAACTGPIAYNAFQTLIPAAQNFAANLKALIPSDLQSVVQSASDSVQSSLNKGLQAFSDAQTAPSSCSGSGGGSGGSTTTGGGSGSGGTPTTGSGSTYTTKSCPAGKHRRRRAVRVEM